MSKVTLNNIGDLTQASTAQTSINTNLNTIQTAFDNTLSRDGTSPNQMGSQLDMNSNHIINLPAPSSANDPIRFQDLSTLQAGGTVTTLPVGGTTGQSLQKNSNTNYDVKWGGNVTSVGLSLPADFTVTGSPVTVAGTLTANYATAPTGTGAFVRAASPTLTGTVTINGSIVDTSGNITSPTVKLAGATSGTTTLSAVAVASGTVTIPSVTDTLVGKATTDTLTNKTLTSPAITSPTITGGFTATGLVTNAALANMAANTIKANNTGGSAAPTDITLAQLAALITKPTTQTFLSGSGTYTLPANATWIEVWVVGGGGGGAGSGTTPGTPTAGGTSTFGSSFLTATGGGLGRVDGGIAAGGTATGGDDNLTGGSGGQGGGNASNTPGGQGGSNPRGCAGSSQPGAVGISASPNSGGGGGGGGEATTNPNAGGGGAGGWLRGLIRNPSATYAYAVGAKGNGGTAGTGGFAGGDGGSGFIQVVEHYI